MHLQYLLPLTSTTLQRTVLHVKAAKKSPESTSSFVEETIVRRELSDNFCFYNENYDSLGGIYPWARESLEIHKADKRTHIYTRDQFNNGETHDDLWNAAKLQVRTYVISL